MAIDDKRFEDFKDEVFRRFDGIDAKLVRHNQFAERLSSVETWIKVLAGVLTMVAGAVVGSFFQ